jgi:hypothetical protein
MDSARNARRDEHRTPDGGLPGDPGSSLGGLVIFLRLKASTAAEALACGL